MLPSGLPSTFIHFTHHSYAQMVRVLKRTAARCAHIAKTYSIGRSFNGKELLVIEFSSRPGQHELSKPLLLSGARVGPQCGLASRNGPWGVQAGVWDPSQNPRCLGTGHGWGIWCPAVHGPAV